MSITIFIIDTSYLIEFAACGRDSIPAVTKSLKLRFKVAAGKGARFFVPLPCLFELGDHIADVGHEERRTGLADWLVSTVHECIASSIPWCITPTNNPSDILPGLLQRFLPLASKQKVGLVDTFTVLEAERIKQKYHSMKPRVHIWTNDRHLKQLEPDIEPEPFLWRSDGTPI